MPFRRKKAGPPAPPTIEPLGISESQWRGQQLEAARQLVERYCGTSEMPPSLASLDEVVARWFDDHEPDRPEATDLVNAVGIAFGHHVAAASGLTWVLATDAKGTEIALHRAAGEVLVYPTNLVAEQVVANERSFLVPLAAEVAARP